MRLQQLGLWGLLGLFALIPSAVVIAQPDKESILQQCREDASGYREPLFGEEPTNCLLFGVLHVKRIDQAAVLDNNRVCKGRCVYNAVRYTGCTWDPGNINKTLTCEDQPPQAEPRHSK